jgi:hypothetical protein
LKTPIVWADLHARLKLLSSTYAGVGIRALLLAQDYQDIVAEYGEHERITAECSTTVAHAPNSNQDGRVAVEALRSDHQGHRGSE